jgi:predicted kinase
MKKVIILRGCSGSGKSSYARKLQAWAVVVSGDNFFVRGGQYLFDPILLPQAHQECFSKFLEAIADQCEIIVVDNTNIHKWEFISYFQVASMFDYSVEIVEFIPETVEQIKKCIQRNVHGVPAMAVMKQVLEFEKAGDDFHVFVEQI